MKCAPGWGDAFEYRPQGAGDLGKRMNRALAEALDQGFRRVVLVGSDLPDLTPEILLESLAALGRCDLALGPAKDGGYYLIGLSRPAPELFSGVDWGGASVLARTLDKARTAGLSYGLLGELCDVDRPEDLPLWQKARRPVWAPGRISVIIPTFDEADNLVGAVAGLAGARDCEGAGDRRRLKRRHLRAGPETRPGGWCGALPAGAARCAAQRPRPAGNIWCFCTPTPGWPRAGTPR